MRHRHEWSKYYQLPGTHCVKALHARFVTHQFPRHAHEHFVIGLVERGAQSYWYRGARHVTPAGQVFVVNPEEPHTGESAAPAGYVYRTLYPCMDDLARAARDLGDRGGSFFFREAVLNDRSLATLLSRCHRAIAENRSSVECESLYLRVLVHLVTAHAEPRVSARPQGKESFAVKRAREYMLANFDQDIALSDLARLVALSPYYFARTFETAVGLPPHSYLEGIRIRKACELMTSGESLANTAAMVGYSDQSHFTHRFKRFLGMTPGQYKIQQDSTRPATWMPVRVKGAQPGS
jgi:AraC-like DNA-binding protein